MNSPRISPLSAFALAAFTAAALCSVSASAADRMPMDRPVTMDGITAVCTGIGESKDDPRWKAYPIRVEFSNGGAQYLAGGHVELSDAAGKQIASVDCSGAWVLFQLPTGNYKVSASLLDHQGAGARSASFTVPAKGQKRVVLEFKGVNPNE